MSEPIMQIPESLDTNELRQVARNDGLWESEAVLVETAADEIDRLRALLSQPTPTAEPPSIEEMAPGTTFTEEVRWTVTGTLSTGSTVAHSRSGEMRFADRFDPSTIRDVTPPKDSDANA